MKISVIIPTYEPQDYLWECLESLKKQSFDLKEFEIILILNGCKEPYYTDINNYIFSHLKECNVKFFYTEQPGVSNARNIGINNSKGDYIAFIDDDDYVSESYLQELYEATSSESIPVCNVLAFNDGGRKIIKYFISDLFNRIKSNDKSPIMKARSYMSIPVAKLINRDYILDRRFNIHFKNGEDSLFMLLISDKIRYVKPTSEKAIYYRRFRLNSAVTRKKSFSEILVNKVNLAFAYLPCLVRPWKYNFLFCLTRYAALLKSW